MKWLKFLTQTTVGSKTYQPGEIAELTAADADAQIAAKTAELTTEPPEISAAAKALADKFGTAIDRQVTLAMQGFEKTLADAVGAVSNRKPFITTHDNSDDDPTFGFKNANDQVRAIAKWGMGSARDERLVKMANAVAKGPSVYGSESIGADGGFLLAPNFVQTVLEYTLDEGSLLALTDDYTTTSNNLTVPKDETTPWGTNGVRAYWTNEGGQATATKPVLGQSQISLNKLTALIPLTDEQISDSFTGLGSYVVRKAGSSIRYKTDEAIVNGTGAGQPLGFTNSSALVTVTATGNATTGVLIKDVANMIAHVPGSMQRGMRWLVGPGTFPDLVVLTNANSSLYIAPGALERTSGIMGMLLGIPLTISEHCQARNSANDLMLVSFPQYLSLTKGQGPEVAMSIHLYFDYSISAFRVNFRVGGQPWMLNPIVSANDATFKLSPFVSLGTRS